MAAQSYPEYWVTGPIHHYIRVKGSSAIYYLGTAEVTPQTQWRQYKQTVFNDEAGKTLGGQYTYDGQAAMVSVTFSRWSRLAWEQLMLRGANRGLTYTFGQETRWSRGALVLGNMDFELWQVYENSLNPYGPNRTVVGLELGRYWPQVLLENEDQIKAGTQAETPLFVFDCQPKRIPQQSLSSVNAETNERGWMLLGLSDAWFPADVLIPQ